MSNAALRAAYAEAMQGAPPAAAAATPTPTPTIPPSTETPALGAPSTPEAPGPSVSSSPNDLPVIGGVDFAKLGLTPEQIARLHEQTVTLRAEEDISADHGEPTPIPVRRADGGPPPPAAAGPDSTPSPTLDPEVQAELDQARILKGFLAENPEAVAALAELAAKKARADGQPVEATGPRKLTRQEYAELDEDAQLEYLHQQAAARAQASLLPILQKIDAGLRDLKQGEEDRAVIAEKHADFAQLPKDHYLRATVERIRAAQPGLTLVQAVEQAKELANFVREGAKREIQAGQARVASTQVHKPQTAQTRELELDPRSMLKQGRTSKDVLRALWNEAQRKQGADVNG